MSCHNLFYSSSLYEGGFQPFFFPIDIVPPSPIKHQLCQCHDNSFQSSTKYSPQSTRPELLQLNKPSSQPSTKSALQSSIRPSLQLTKSEVLQPSKPCLQSSIKCNLQSSTKPLQPPGKLPPTNSRKQKLSLAAVRDSKRRKK